MSTLISMLWLVAMLCRSLAATKPLFQIQQSTPIPRIVRLLVCEKNTQLRLNHVSGTVLMIQLTENSPTFGHIRVNRNCASGNHVMQGV